jgi:hypothetical protein
MHPKAILNLRRSADSAYPKVYIPALRPSSWSEFKDGVLKAEPKYG